VQDFLEYLQKQWPLFTDHPFPLIVTLVLASGLAYGAAAWRYESIIQILRERLGAAEKKLADSQNSPATNEADKGPQASLPPNIEIHTEPAGPYQTTAPQAGRVISRVKIGIKNSGGMTASNCKVFVEKVSPPTNAHPDTALELVGSGFRIRHDDTEQIVEIATHWDHVDTFRFSTPHAGGFAEAHQYLDDRPKRSFIIRVQALECQRSAMFNLWTDDSRRLHLEFVSYTD
jgi:hypothetical protein